MYQLESNNKPSKTIGEMFGDAIYRGQYPSGQLTR